MASKPSRARSTFQPFASSIVVLMAAACELSSTTSANRPPVAGAVSIFHLRKGFVPGGASKLASPGHDAVCGRPRGLGGTEGIRSATADMVEPAGEQKAKSAVKRLRNRDTHVT